MTIAAAQAFDFQVGQFAAIAGTGVAASIVAAGNGSSLANGFVMQESATGLARLLFGGNEIVNINANPGTGHGMRRPPAAASPSPAATATRLLRSAPAAPRGRLTASWSRPAPRPPTTARFQSQAGATQYLYLQGDGELFTIVPPAASTAQRELPGRIPRCARANQREHLRACDLARQDARDHGRCGPDAHAAGARERR